MYENAKTLFQEAAKEKLEKSTISFDEINKKIQPNDLLRNSEKLGIAGSTDEVYELEQESKDIKTRNSDLEGKKHSQTDVPYERDTLPDGQEGVFPVFDAKVEIELPEDLYEGTDREQFRYCNKQLKEQIQNNPELIGSFRKEQIEQIDNERTPSGYTWHHHQQPGKMQLVSTDEHAASGHTGGRVIWGGGQDQRA